MKNINNLHCDKTLTVRQNLFKFWLIFCQFMVGYEVFSFVLSYFSHPLHWQVIVACSFGVSLGIFFRKERWVPPQS